MCTRDLLVTHCTQTSVYDSTLRGVRMTGVVKSAIAIESFIGRLAAVSMLVKPMQLIQGQTCSPLRPLIKDLAPTGCSRTLNTTGGSGRIAVVSNPVPSGPCTAGRQAAWPGGCLPAQQCMHMVVLQHNRMYTVIFSEAPVRPLHPLDADEMHALPPDRPSTTDAPTFVSHVSWQGGAKRQGADRLVASPAVCMAHDVNFAS